MSEKVKRQKIPVIRKSISHKKGNSSSMSDKVSGIKRSNDGAGQGPSREKGKSSSDMSVYISSAEESMRHKKSSVYKSSDEYFEHSCDPCKTNGDQVEVQGYCTNCEEYLCDTCFRSHSRSKVSSHHTLLDKDDMPTSMVKRCEPCGTVGDELEAVGYCKDCNEYLCDSCYNSHLRSKLFRNHELMDKATMFQDAATSSIAEVNIHKESYEALKCSEEYTYIRDINVKTETDENDCYISGIALVANTELVLCDYQNKSLKLVDIDSGIIKDVLGIPEMPVKVTTISKDQVAVVLAETYQIKIVSIPDRLTVVRNIKTNGSCLDVKHINGKLYVSFEDPVKFQVLQLTGAIHRTIKPDSKVLEHCACPCYIAVSPDESLIYMSDWRVSKVMSMDTNGNMISMYQDELEEPADIAISPFGSVYLCSRNQDFVYKITLDLREATVELGLEDGVEKPQAICFNTCKKQLYISSSVDVYQNLISVYEWK